MGTRKAFPIKQGILGVDSYGDEYTETYVFEIFLPAWRQGKTCWVFKQ